MRPIPIDCDQVGAFARFDRANLVLETERAGAAASGHPQHLARGQGTGAAADGLECGREPHLLEHVEPVVAGRPVGSE